MALDPQRTKLMDLYFKSNSARFDGPFEFSVHRDNPKLEKSPSYLHYPKAGESGSEYLPELYDLVGELLDEYINNSMRSPAFERVTAIPSGADPLARALVERRNDPNLLLHFSKDKEAENQAPFTFTKGQFKKGDRVLVIDDHVSGGRNKKLIKTAAENAGLKVTDMITVVNRQQGGVEAMARAGVRLHWILTLEDILQYGVAAGYIDEPVANQTRGYVQRNQLGS